MNTFAWYLTETGSPKTHHKRTCTICNMFGYKSGCTLPFRKTHKVPERVYGFIKKEKVKAFRRHSWIKY